MLRRNGSRAAQEISLEEPMLSSAAERSDFNLGSIAIAHISNSHLSYKIFEKLAINLRPSNTAEGCREQMTVSVGSVGLFDGNMT